MIMYNVFQSLTPRGANRLIHTASSVIASPTESSSSSSPSSVNSFLEEDVKVHHRRTTLTNEDDSRHEEFTNLHRVETNERISSITTTMAKRPAVPIRRHRRTNATNWDELTSRLDSSNIRGIQPRRHRRTLAMTNDEFMEITMVCDELHGPIIIPWFL